MESPARTWHYVTLVVHNKTDSRDILMPISDLFFIRRVIAPDGEVIHGDWAVSSDPLHFRGTPEPEQLETTPIPIGGEQTISLAFATPLGRMLELGLATDWQRGIAYGLPIWFVPEPNPEAPFRGADHPPPPTSAFLDDVAVYNGLRQPITTVSSGTPWPTLPPGATGRWPTTGIVTRGFSCQGFFTGIDGKGWGCPPETPWFHPGIDISNLENNPITAPVSGQVLFAGSDQSGPDCSDFAGSNYPHAGFGNYLKLSGEGMLHYFAHLATINASNGSALMAGQQVGAMGSTGCSTGTHLHWQVKLNGQLIDPAIWAGAGPPP